MQGPFPAPSHSRVVHVFGAWEGLQGPVEEAVEEDEARTAGPNQQDEDEGDAQVVDHLGNRRSTWEEEPGPAQAKERST